jgi:hypothetical protein
MKPPDESASLELQNPDERGAVGRVVASPAPHVARSGHRWVRFQAWLRAVSSTHGRSVSSDWSSRPASRAAMARISRFGPRVVACYKAIAILTLNALVVCAGLELAAFGVLETSKLVSSAEERPVREGGRRDVSYYSSQDWARQYWYEHDLSVTLRYYPYVGWRRAPFKGRTIEVDQNGVRLTPGSDCSARSFKVFTFGASEMWGTGSPNWETIPAHLQKGFEKLRRRPVCVTNFAESSYVSTQDLITLLVQLRSANVPDVVLFYNIGGDIYSAYQSGRAGTSENLDRLAARFEKRPDLVLDMLRDTYSYALLDKLMGRLTIADSEQEDRSPEAKLVTYESMGVDLAILSEAIVQNYFGNYEIVSALAQKYGFKYFFFLPPVLLTGNKSLTSEEQNIKRKEIETEPALSRLFIATYQTIERHSSRYPNFHSMNHIFDQYDSFVWIDPAHVTPLGNQLIASRMLDIIPARSSDTK